MSVSRYVGEGAAVQFTLGYLQIKIFMFRYVLTEEMRILLHDHITASSKYSTLVVQKDKGIR